MTRLYLIPCLVALFIAIPDEGLCQPMINVSFGELSQVVFYEGQEVAVNVTVLSYNGTDDVRLNFESERLYTFEVVNSSYTVFEVSQDDVFPTIYTVRLKAHHIGISSLRVMMAAVGSEQAEEVAALTIKVNVGNDAIQLFLQYIFYVPLVSTFFIMGLTMELGVIKACFQRPLGIGIGFICQFVFMPALAFAIGKALRLEPMYHLGLLMMGCSPGGKLSNDLTILLEGDVVLSVTMTACSTTLALGMMPLNIFIYSRFITHASVATPYASIATQIAILVSPLAIGIFVRYYFPKVEAHALKIIKPVVALVILISVSIALPFVWYMFVSPAVVYLAGFLLPFCGVVSGGCLAKLSRLKNKQVIAISLETGVQNGLFASTVLKAVYPSPEADLARSGVLFCFIFTVLIGCVVTILRMLWKRFGRRSDTEEKDTKELIEGNNQAESIMGVSEGGDVILTSINGDISNSHIPNVHEVEGENSNGPIYDHEIDGESSKEGKTNSGFHKSP